MRNKRGASTTDAILLAAKAVFAGVGYEQASMDEVAAAAGTTKRTVYNHFGSKDRLFRAVIEASAALFGEALYRPDPEGEPAVELEAYLARFVELVTWDGAVGLQRVVLAEVERFPDLSVLLHAQALGRAEMLLADFISEQADRGRLALPDPVVAARSLLGLAAYRIHLAVLFGATPPLAGSPTEEASAAVDHAAIRQLVGWFLAGARTTNA